MYATYITIYKGNKLPPFYIGHAKISNIENGYLGSVSSKLYKHIWIEEIANNRSVFSIKILKKFDNKKEALKHERFLQKSLNVHKNPLYINMSIVSENYFVANPECLKGRKHTDESKKKLSLSAKKQFENPKKRQKHLDAFYKADGNHTNKIWINKNGKNKRVTKENYNENFSDWNIGRVFGEGPQFYDFGNRKQCPKTGRFI